MAVLRLSLLGLATVVCVENPGDNGRHFPLDGCSTDEMDFLFLYFKGRLIFPYCFQIEYARIFASVLIPSRKKPGGLTFGEVTDQFNNNYSQVNAASWRFRPFIKPQLCREGHDGGINKDNTTEVIALKVQFVKRLFAEMGGVRQNATHVAVIFLDGSNLSLEDSRRVPGIVRQQDTGVKIFTVVCCVKFDTSLTYLRDTLLVGYNDNSFSGDVLSMKMCNQCAKRRFSFKLSYQTESLSCYFFMEHKIKVSSYAATKDCIFNGGSLVTIESIEELEFLEEKIYRYFVDSSRFKSHSKNSSAFTEQLFIGLKKDSTHVGKQFHWSLKQLSQTRPLVVQKWLPGKPSGGNVIGCGVWQFVWNGSISGATNGSNNSARFIDGWEDVDCFDEVSSLSLCEINYPERFEKNNMLRIKPAKTNSFKSALAKGDLMKYKSNIVSVSANVPSQDFVEHLKRVNNLFPIFDCGVGIPDPHYISYMYVCDGVVHCSNRRDEMFCGLSSDNEKRQRNVEKKCWGLRCCDGFCLPLHRVGDGEVDCNVCAGISGNIADDESDVLLKSLKINESCALFCNDFDGCVHFSQFNDGVTDCRGPDGPLDENLGKLETADTCRSILGRRIWAPKCVYARDIYGAVLGCRDMSHLKGCVDFVCPEGYFKCPNTYCIPQHYVLDGTVDCPAGEDEETKIIDLCTGNFACWDSKVCLHPDLVCDGHPDCPRQDDEVDCHMTCPKGLRCISGTITVQGYTLFIHWPEFHQIGFTIRYIDLSSFKIKETTSAYDFSLDNLIVTFFSGCFISTLSRFFQFTRTIQTLDVSYNLITTLRDIESVNQPFQNLRHLNLSHNRGLVELSDFEMPFLETLDLAHTGLPQLETSFFDLFPRLKHLNLSFTRITNIYRHTFPPHRSLLTLDLRGQDIVDYYEDFFNGLTVSQDLYIDNFDLCCPQVRGPNIPDYACHAPEAAISSCFDLVRINVQRVLLWVVAVLAVLGNMPVILYRVIWDRSVLKTGHGLFVTNLGISDFIMGVYLFIIAGADYYYRGVYVLSDKIWRESVVCRLAGFLVTLSCETSTFFVFLITLERFLKMKFPFGNNVFNSALKIVALIMSWIIGFLLALTPILFQFEIYSSNAMCLGLPLTADRLRGWEFSFAVFIVLNFCLFLLIAYGQRAIFRAMSENRKSWTAARRAQDITVARQLCLVALSNFLCWFPVGIMGILSLGGYDVSNDVYAWTTVIVLPINAAANPLLYTIPTLNAKWNQFKHEHIMKRSNSSYLHSLEPCDLSDKAIQTSVKSLATPVKTSATSVKTSSSV